MLYVGQFSFNAPEEGAPLESLDRGSFTCLVEAEDVEEAVEKFSDLVISLDDSFEGFESVGDVYLDHITEVKNLPPEGVLSYYERRTSDGLGTISTALPGVPQEACGSYSWGDGPENEDEVVERKPFVHQEG